jgi:hypothetical protein
LKTKLGAIIELHPNWQLVESWWWTVWFRRIWFRRVSFYMVWTSGAFLPKVLAHCGDGCQKTCQKHPKKSWFSRSTWITLSSS